MLASFLATVLVFLVACVYLRWVQVRRYWAARGVPHRPPHPLLGSLTFLLRESSSAWLRRMREQLPEPYAGIWVFWRPGLLINSPELARNVLIRDQAVFRNRLASSGTTDPVGKLNIFTLNDPLWTSIRKCLTVLFTGSKLRGLQVLLTQKSKELVQRIEKDRLANTPVDLKMLITDYTTDVIGSTSFGVVCDATLTGESPIRTVTREFMRFGVVRGMSWCAAFFFPELVNLFRFKVWPSESTEYMRKMMREMIAQRGGLENRVTEPKDLLDILIKIQQENKELDMTENMMLAQAAVFLQGGFDTSASTVSFCIYEMAFAPDVQEKLFRELKEAEEQYADNLLDANTLSKLTYLNCVINEALRKYPIMPWLDRIAATDYAVDDRLTIPAGTPVLVNAYGMHFDPEIFPEPDRFNPDRFLPENEVDRKPCSYLPFGEGPRKCIGQRLGLSSVRHALTAVVLAYEVRPVPGTPLPQNIKMDRNALFVSPEEPLSVQFVPRV